MVLLVIGELGGVTPMLEMWLQEILGERAEISVQGQQRYCEEPSSFQVSGRGTEPEVKQTLWPIPVYDAGFCKNHSFQEN